VAAIPATRATPRMNDDLYRRPRLWVLVLTLLALLAVCAAVILS
jgi:hypothetical protein